MFDPRIQFPIQNPNFGNYQSEEVLQFTANNPNQETAMESDNSSVNSPPLWKSSPSPSHPLLNRHLSLSPNSRKQAIERGQWELMEMVKNMPEASYELSLKDLVQHPAVELESQAQKREVKVTMNRQESKRSAVKFDHHQDKGLLLNLVSPFPVKSKKRAKPGTGNNITNPGGKLSPRLDGEKDWWKKKFTGSTDSDSSRTTTTSGGSDNGRSRKRNGSPTGCWPFLQSRRTGKANL